MGNYRAHRRGIATLLILASSVLAPSHASAHHDNNSGYVSMGSSDYVYNYDFMSSGSWSYSNHDWFVMIVFAQNATINKVKNGLNSQGYGAGGSTKYGRISDNGTSNFVMDADGGRDTNSCPYQTHYRLYADSDDRLGFNATYGYFVIGTTHLDLAHGCAGTDLFGWSAEANGNVRTAAQNVGWSVSADSVTMSNGIAQNHMNGNSTRYYQNAGAGKADRINVP